MTDFAAIDFETANGQRSSVCSVGVVVVRRYFGRRLPNHQLHTVAAACGCPMENHHHALADAEACARIALRLL